jgi:hypothetical protein
MLLGCDNGKIKVLLEHSIKNNGKKYIFISNDMAVLINF